MEDMLSKAYIQPLIHAMQLFVNFYRMPFVLMK